jgi:hypothetical protein
MGALANMGYGAMLGPDLQEKMTKPFDKALSATEMDEPNKEMMKEAGYKKGGSVSKRADGIATKGKTRGRIV